jgi:hypothetical protein
MRFGDQRLKLSYRLHQDQDNAYLLSILSRKIKHSHD